MKGEDLHRRLKKAELDYEMRLKLFELCGSTHWVVLEARLNSMIYALAEEEEHELDPVRLNRIIGARRGLRTFKDDILASENLDKFRKNISRIKSEIAKLSQY
jgi:hypothetical protein